MACRSPLLVKNRLNGKAWETFVLPMLFVYICSDMKRIALLACFSDLYRRECFPQL